MKLFEWLPMSEEDHRGKRYGHQLWMNCHHLHFGRFDVMIGGMVWLTLYPWRVFRGLGLKHWPGGEHELDLWLIHFYINPPWPMVSEDESEY